MRIPLILAIVAVALQLFSDIYLFSVAWRRCRKLFWAKFQIWESAFFVLFAILIFILFGKVSANNGLPVLMWMILAYIAVYAGKFTFIIFDLIASIPKLFKRKHKRRKRIGWLSWVGLAMAALVFFSIIWGATINRFNIQVKEQVVDIVNLPDSFDGYRIVHISDLHVGTYGNDTTFISKVVNRINALEADLVVFTGDIVNQHSQELRPFVKPLSRITSRDGVMSILGNHDYGDYYRWESETEKEHNMRELMDLQIEMGWELLTNCSEVIYGEAATDSLVIIGVENWGDPPFPQIGDLNGAYPALGDSATKILLTHNPVHWKTEVEPNTDRNICLTLSGHTHAMQIRMGNISPAAIRYRNCWAGRYDSADGKRTLYVNTGIGTVGLPLRLGATPEITLLTLKKLNSTDIPRENSHD